MTACKNKMVDSNSTEDMHTDYALEMTENTHILHILYLTSSTSHIHNIEYDVSAVLLHCKPNLLWEPHVRTS